MTSLPANGHIAVVGLRFPTVAAALSAVVLSCIPLAAQGADSSPPAQPLDTVAFLGMGIASSITVNADGLTELKGLHNSIWADALPVTEDLQIYTRWTGTGTHTIDVTIVERDTGESLARTSDELDFGTDRVTYYTHDFSATSFPREGAYAVEATLDGRSVAAYALYVNARDGITDAPAFVLSVPAEGGQGDVNGQVGISGIFEYFSFPRFPATDSFDVVSVFFSGDGTFDCSVRISDERGRLVAESPHSMLTAAPGRMSLARGRFTSVAFPSAGVYTATVLLDGETLISYPLVIRGR